MQNPWHFFDKIYCINLKHRTDRWHAAMKEFEKIGIVVERFEACEGENKFEAFNNSQASVLRKALADGCWRFLILEDDVVFSNTAHLRMALQQLPYNWDMLFLGANVIGDDTRRWPRPTKISNNLCRLWNGWQTQSVAYSKKGAQHILDNFKPDGGLIYDEWLRVNVMPSKLVYITYPQMTYQAPGFSDIWNVQADYTSLLARGNNIMS